LNALLSRWIALWIKPARRDAAERSAIDAPGRFEA
jgi:hypothetical protein